MCFFCFDNFWVSGSLQTSWLCIMGELAGGGSVAVAVGISDMWQVTCNTWHMTHDMKHMTHETLHIFSIIFYLLIMSVYICFGIGATIRTRQEIQYLLYFRILFKESAPWPILSSICDVHISVCPVIFFKASHWPLHPGASHHWPWHYHPR